MKRSLIGLLMALPMLGFAQSNFHKGYVLTNSKDTLKGYLDYKETKENPVVVIFKQDMEAAPQTYSLKDCAGYGINDLVTYQRHVVSISSGTDDIRKISEFADTSFKRAPVFLQVIQAGQHVNFFYYEDEIKGRYYILDKVDQEPQELIRLLYRKGNMQGLVLTSFQYARQLMLLLRKYDKSTPAIESRLGRLKYQQDDLLAIVALINDQQVEKSKFPKARFFAGLGVNGSSLGITGGKVNPGAEFKLSFGPVVAVGIDFFANPAIRRMMFRMELAVSMANNKISDPLYAESFDQLEAVLSPQVIYHLYNAADFKVFIGGGVGLNLSRYSNHRVMLYKQNPFTEEKVLRRDDPEDMFALEPVYFSVPLCAGVVLNKKIALSMGYSMPTAITNYPYFNLTKQQFRLGVNYLFGKH